jgi:chemotaxis protein MotB
MKTYVWLLLCVVAVATLPGCLLAPRTELNAAQTENHVLAEQNRAQLVEIEELKTHGKTLEERLVRSEQQLARSQERAGLEETQLASYERERDGLYDQFKTLSLGRGRLPPALCQQLVDLSKRFPSLQFDPETGISKLDTDILFDSGEAVLKPGAAQLLDELVQVLKSPAAGELKIMVAGHTDAQQVAGKTVRDKYPNNFHLSTARALAVADRMKRAGLPEHRLGVSGFGPCQPIASNGTPQDRQKNRRVEIFVMAADVPVIGWSDSTPSVYTVGNGRPETGARRQ